MILFLNVFITNKFLTYYYRGLLPSFNRLDVFKYSLASLSVIKWSRVIIYYELDTIYENRRSELDEYIQDLFDQPVVFNYRNTQQSHWQKAMEELFSLEDDLVWFLCNDDHIFIDYETSLLYRIEAKLKKMSAKYPYVSCNFSHWPEYLYMGSKYYSSEGTIECSEDYCVRILSTNNSIQIVNKNWLRYVWFEHDYGDAFLPRTDWRKYPVKFPPAACIIPYREMVRHFDGYSHVGLDINACPPLFIPEGFFQKDIKVLYCAAQRKSRYVHINPTITNYSTVDPKGVDLRCCLEDLPLFWKPRIVTIEVANEIDRDLLFKHRDAAVTKLGFQAHFKDLYAQNPKNILKDFAETIQIALRSDNLEIEFLNKSIVTFATKNIVASNIYWRHYKIGEGLAKLTNARGAAYAFSVAVELNPNSAWSHYGLGQALYKQNKVKEAEAHYHRALQINPDVWCFHNELGVCFSKQGQVEESINCWRKAIELNPNSFWPYAHIAGALARIGNLEEAASYLQKAIKLNPNLPRHLRKNLRDILTKLSQEREATKKDNIS